MPARSAGRQRPLWILLMAAGAFGLWSGGRIGGDDGGSIGEFHDTGDYVAEELRAGSRGSVGGAIVVAGGIVFFLGFFAFVRSFGGEVREAGGGGLQAGDLFAAAGLRPGDITPELLAAAGLTADDLPPGMLEANPARPPPPGPASPANVPFDPTFWTHPAAILYVFEERPATGFYELVRELRDRHLRDGGLLVALLQSLGPDRKKVVAVLGSDASVRAFDRAFQADVGARVDSGALDWLKLRPDVQLQRESYDPRYVVQDPSDYEALRTAMRRAEYMVLAADGG